MNKKVQGIGSFKDGAHVVMFANGTKNKMTCEQVVSWLRRHNINPPQHCVDVVDGVKVTPVVSNASVENKVELWANGVDPVEANYRAKTGLISQKQIDKNNTPSVANDSEKPKSKKLGVKSKKSNVKSKKEPLPESVSNDNDDNVEIEVDEITKLIREYNLG